MLRKHPSQEHDVQLALVVADKHSRPDAQVFLVDHLELQADQRASEVLERPARGPLRYAGFPHQSERNGCHHSICGYRYE